MYIPDTSRKYTPEEKQQLLQNLDIEVEHRVRQLEEWLTDALKNFRLHQEGLISRIPKLVRGVTMGEFADTYNGDVQACLRGLVGGAPPNLEIDRETRKRKWEEASEGERAVKNARTMHVTPKKKPPPANAGTAQRIRTLSAAVPRTPGQFRSTLRLPSVSPQKPSTLRTSPSKLRAPSPFKLPSSPGKSIPWNAKPPSQAKRPPTSATFAPTLPAKTPTYPTLRAPRRDESMLSLNGSPLANPYKLGLEWFAAEEEEEGSDMDVKTKGKGKETQVNMQGQGKTLRRVNSIVIRRDPSVSLVPSSSTQPTFSQTHSQAYSQTQNHNRTHSRANSRTAARVPESPASKPATSSLMSSSSLSSLPSSSSARAVVAISTSDGHVLEFDPLQTSPRALDALVGITDSAKKQAREDMGRLVQAAVSKWSIA
ncbi:uncharacterized protein F5891DRAFT_529474 [Suillus fuscotomentosus]|uniref:Borealin N-terminal domain-containing protein n=1 Tax=Suillus fuscotomentosus TaxID=1912939 RepID=A0AAD4E0G8_9AGAM|nr:uncharacterized protein F5891DRAFT_773368 [Suillus fuscotomentosus]XP_041223036.1 uncharacterized protein F5891DRAFT_529474 [Suillus fuscotomentosus]KAG1893473.1 hypothetical protein F5891DRAFT_773368 [Suillus fuscotomentosus]KAG1897460.1 hypothetical protein F5891DRAFT_529474 [Suillus fuscotomentosus]